MKTLQEILKEYNLNITTNPRYGTDKGAPKTFVDGFYQEKFEPLRNKKLTLVEIGVRSGASLKIRHRMMKSGCLMVYNSSMLMGILRKL